MKRFLFVTLFAASLGLQLHAGETPSSATPDADKPRPEIQVAFVLDTTGSMGGLIADAKAKIWSIANEILRGKPTPDLRIALVAYRDKGDEYVTKVFDFTDDLDKVYSDLRKFRAAGGGDGPEHVNRALHDAVHRLAWGEAETILKLVYLVGDAPPHMDYDDGFDYRKVAQEAIRKDLIIHTIRCGGNRETEKIWKDIAVRSEGRYARLAQSGESVAVSTPFDSRLAELNRALNRTYLFFGEEGTRLGASRRLSEADEAGDAVAATRAGALAKSPRVARKSADLVSAYERKKVDLEALKTEELPAKLRGESVEEIQNLLKEHHEERQKILAQIRKLSKERDDYVKKELARKPGKRAAFDEWVLTSLRADAAKKGICYGEKPER